MLHIIGLIFKIIGILLAVILGILVLLFCIVLFVPFRYEIDAEFPGNVKDIKVSGKFSWFLHFISGWIRYDDGKLEWQVRAAWRRFSNEAKEEIIQETVPKKEIKAVKETLPKKEIEEKSSPKKEKIDVKENVPAENNKLKDALINEVPKEQEESSVCERILERFRRWYAKIKYTFREICDKIKEISKTKEEISEFLQNESHKRAFSKIMKETVWIRRFLKPKKVMADIHFGFEDPYMTGLSLALLSMIYPFAGEYMSIEPDFEEKVLEGRAKIKGGLRISHLVMMAVRLILDREVRILIKDVRKRMR